MHKLDSDDPRILRDLADEPMEPLAIEFGDIYYEYVSAEVVGKHPAHTNEDEKYDIKLTLQRYDDFTVGVEDAFYNFIVSFEWIQEHMDALYDYLHVSEDKWVFESIYPLSNQYAQRSREHKKNGADLLARACFHVSRVLHANRDDIDVSIIVIGLEIDNLNGLKLALELLKEEKNIQ